MGQRDPPIRERLIKVRCSYKIAMGWQRRERAFTPIQPLLQLRSDWKAPPQTLTKRSRRCQRELPALLGADPTSARSDATQFSLSDRIKRADHPDQAGGGQVKAAARTLGSGNSDPRKHSVYRNQGDHQAALKCHVTSATNCQKCSARHIDSRFPCARIGTTESLRMHSRDAVFLDELCPKLRVRRWRQSLHKCTSKKCIYCGKPSESIDHIHPRAHGGLSVTQNCVPSCLSCNGHKSDAEVFDWYRRQRFYDPRRAMAIRAWMDGDMRLALRLLQWAQPLKESSSATDQEDSNMSYQAA